jgi:hypothetical protein
VQAQQLYTPKFVSSAKLREVDNSAKLDFRTAKFPRFRGSRNPQADFTSFRVIDILIVAHPTSTLSAIDSTLEIRSKFSTSGFTNMPTTNAYRFVILGPGSRGQSFMALPIKTYDYRGASGPKVIKSHHSIIYTGLRAPNAMEGELPPRHASKRMDHSLREPAIRVIPFENVGA